MPRVKALYVTLCIIGMVLGSLGVGLLRGEAAAGLALVVVGFPMGIIFAILVKRTSNRSGKF